MEKYYSTTIQSLGSQSDAFIGEDMLILFEENSPQPIPENLRQYCILHRGNELNGEIAVGDVLELGAQQYTIVYVGAKVQENLKNLGHITLRFNANRDNENMEGSLYLEDKPIAKVKPGDEIAIFKA